MAEFSIRPYNPDTDYPAVEANLIQSGLFDQDRDTQERLRKFADSVIVAEKAGKVVGSVYVVDHIVPTLNRLVVNEDHRLQGIGGALLIAARHRLNDSGAVDMEVFFKVDRNSSFLSGWYKEHGFRDTAGGYISMWSYTDPDSP